MREYVKPERNASQLQLTMAGGCVRSPFGGGRGESEGVPRNTGSGEIASRCKNPPFFLSSTPGDEREKVPTQDTNAKCGAQHKRSPLVEWNERGGATRFK